MRQADVTRVDVSVAGPFRYRALDGTYLITNDFGDWLLLAPRDLRAFVHGDIAPGDTLYERLRDRRFIHGELDLDDVTRRYRDRRHFLLHGPRHHVLALTGREAEDAEADPALDMSEETATRAVDCAFMSTSPALTLVLRGGEPLASRAVLEHVVRYARDKNRLARKALTLELHTDLRLCDDATLAWIVEQGLDVHVRVRPEMLTDPEAPGVRWTRELHARRAEGPAATLVAVLDAALAPQAEALANLAVDLRCAALDLRAARNDRFLGGEGDAAGLDPDAWLAAWGTALDKLLARAADGAVAVEAGAAGFLARALARRDPDRRDVRSPASDGIGQLAYHWDGRVFASDEGRELWVDAEDPLFQIGELRYHGYHDMITSPTVRALVLASTLDGQPDCVECAYKPFCGQSPARNYAEQGSIQGRMRDSSTCRRLKGMQDRLFRALRDADAATRDALDAWAGAGDEAAG